MLRRFNLVLVVVVLGLTVVLAREVYSPIPTAPALAMVTLHAPALAVARISTSTTAATVLARPLFSRSRRTPPMPASAPLPPPPPSLPVPRLAGVSGGLERRVFLTRANGKTAVLSLGEMLDGFVVRAIGPDSTTLEGLGAVHVLHLVFATGTAGGSAVASASTSPLADAGLGDAPPPVPSAEDAARVRAVLASAVVMDSAPSTDGCCVTNLGWARGRRSNMPAGAPPEAARP